MRYFVTLIVVIAAFYPRWVRGVTPGQVDDFEDGTVQGWAEGAISPNPPANSIGGPLGASDHFLQLTSTGGAGAGSKMTIFNTNQWSGDFTTAGINIVRMQMNNFGPTSLSMRLMFDSLADRSVSTSPIVLSPSSGWVTVDFPVSATDLTAIFGTNAGAVANVQRLWLFHNDTGTGFPGPGIAASLGVDNITAIPETTTAALYAGIAGLLIRRRGKKS